MYTQNMFRLSFTHFQRIDPHQYILWVVLMFTNNENGTQHTHTEIEECETYLLVEWRHRHSQKCFSIPIGFGSIRKLPSTHQILAFDCTSHKHHFKHIAHSMPQFFTIFSFSSSSFSHISYFSFVHFCSRFDFHQ